jgi:methyl-accepting chemotaxis protein
MKLSLGAKLYLTLVPVVVTGIVSILLARTGLNTNAQELFEARQLQERALRSLNLLLTQDDASKALLIDMENADAGERKIGAYDEMQAIFALMKTSAGASGVRELIEQLEQIDQKELRPLDTQLLETMGAGQSEEARAMYFQKYEPIRARFEAGTRQLISIAEKNAAAATLHMEQKNKRSFLLISSSLGIGLALAGLILIVVTRRMTVRLRKAAVTLEEEAEFTTKSTGELESASQTVADGARRQAAALQQTAASLEEISSMTQRNAEHARAAKGSASETRVAADASAADMAEMVKAMDELRACSKGVSSITKTIDEIAFQTNILALNAAVEAARAGEAGLSFAVVAEEVRSVSLRSKAAARETAECIEDSLRKIERGVELSTQVATSLRGMTKHAHQVDGLVGEIAASCQEQSQGLSDLNKAVQSIDVITQSNTESASQSAEAATQLSAQSESMKVTVADLRELIYGTRSLEQNLADSVDASLAPADVHGVPVERARSVLV